VSYKVGVFFYGCQIVIFQKLIPDS